MFCSRGEKTRNFCPQKQENPENCFLTSAAATFAKNQIQNQTVKTTASLSSCRSKPLCAAGQQQQQQQKTPLIAHLNLPLFNNLSIKSWCQMINTVF